MLQRIKGKWTAVCDECDTPLEESADDRKGASLLAGKYGWERKPDGTYYCPTCQNKVKEKSE